MRTFIVRYTLEAQMDMENVYQYIANECHAPMSAARYFNGLLDRIASLSRLGDIPVESPSEWLQQHYGPSARTVAY